MQYFNNFNFQYVKFLFELHDCHKCKYKTSQVHSKTGKNRIFCTKYNLHIQKVSADCIDCFRYFFGEEDYEIEKQYHAGTAVLVIEGAMIK